MSKKHNEQGSKRAMLLALLGVIIIVVGGVIAIMVYRSQTEASNFQECRDNGGTVTGEQCDINGNTFVNDGEQPVDNEEDDATSEYVGLTEEEALQRARDNDKVARVVERDGESLTVTMDLRSGRLNFTVEDGVVVSVEEEMPNVRGPEPSSEE